ncbi:MAG: hypothetical protein HeimC3_38530 [Candidatus Heimdallarchaeota archaeon LC_3]|nr:MAG: hypothetical protein HeimC3_38530 [Candidatus Heimdallarchaeota archaeon LC_3]
MFIIVMFGLVFRLVGKISRENEFSLFFIKLSFSRVKFTSKFMSEIMNDFLLVKSVIFDFPFETSMKFTLKNKFDNKTVKQKYKIPFFSAFEILHTSF